MLQKKKALSTTSGRYILQAYEGSHVSWTREKQLPLFSYVTCDPSLPLPMIIFRSPNFPLLLGLLPDRPLENHLEGLLAIFSPRYHCPSCLQLIELGPCLPFLCLPRCNMPPLTCCRLPLLFLVYLLSTL